jgi:hypothetical protein
MHRFRSALLLIASLSTTAIAASAQEAPKPEQREGVTLRHVHPPAQSAGLQVAELNSLPDAPVPVMKRLAPNQLTFAVPQQQGTQYPPAGRPNPNRRKYIVLGVICGAAVVAGIVIATQRD